MTCLLCEFDLHLRNGEGKRSKLNWPWSRRGGMIMRDVTQRHERNMLRPSKYNFAVLF